MTYHLGSSQPSSYSRLTPEEMGHSYEWQKYEDIIPDTFEKLLEVSRYYLHSKIKRGDLSGLTADEKREIVACIFKDILRDESALKVFPNKMTITFDVEQDTMVHLFLGNVNTSSRQIFAEEIANNLWEHVESDVLKVMRVIESEDDFKRESMEQYLDELKYL